MEKRCYDVLTEYTNILTVIICFWLDKSIVNLVLFRLTFDKILSKLKNYSKLDNNIWCIWKKQTKQMDNYMDYGNTSSGRYFNRNVRYYRVTLTLKGNFGHWN